MFTKEDFVPDGADKFLHTLAPFLALFPVMITFVVIPFGDAIWIHGHRIGLEAANLNSGVLYVLATIGLGVYGVALAGWASNNRWALLGGIRGTAQTISYELAMGLAIVSIIMTFGTLNLQEMVRGQGGVWFGFPPGESSSSRWRSCSCSSPVSPNPSASRSTCPRASRS